MISRSFGTHNGTFHADEVTACALLLVFDLIDQDKIYRSRNPEVLENCEFVCDVGGVYNPAIKRFDHHQLEYVGELASAGMIWKYLYNQNLVDQALYNYVNGMLVFGVDAHDNGKVLHQEGVTTFSHIISNLVPISHSASAKELDDAFNQAVEFTKGHLSRLIERYHYIHGCEDIVAAAMAPNDQFLIFDEAMPWQESFFKLGGETHPALFVVMPSGDHFKLRGIPPNTKDRMGVRKPLPKAWAGLRDEELQRETGIPGAIFCHKGRFISVFTTKKDALNALNAVLRGEEGSS